MIREVRKIAGKVLIPLVKVKKNISNLSSNQVHQGFVATCSSEAQGVHGWEGGARLGKERVGLNRRVGWKH